jgi:hypothetical protein
LVTRARGASTLGCLFTLIVVGAIVYFGINIGRVYWRFYEYQDDLRTEVRFAGTHTNEQIAGHLKASADSLGLPEAAGKISIRRNDRSIAIEAEYYENVELPMYVKEIRFHPHAEGPL